MQLPEKAPNGHGAASGSSTARKREREEQSAKLLERVDVDEGPAPDPFLKGLNSFGYFVGAADLRKMLDPGKTEEQYAADRSNFLQAVLAMGK